MPSKTKTALAALLFFGSASAVLANTNSRTDQYGSVAGRAGSVAMPTGRTGAANHAVKPAHAFGVEQRRPATTCPLTN